MVEPGVAGGSPDPQGSGLGPQLAAGLAAWTVLVAQAEQQIRQAVWDALTGWLVAVSRAVLSAPRPDPTAVWATTAQWSNAVDTVIIPAIVDVIGAAFTDLVGEGDYDRRPPTITHLATVRNRLVRVPDQVFDLIAAEIAVAVDRGESIPKIAERVDQVLSSTGARRWPNRATVIARTEALGALNAGRYAAHLQIAADSDTPMDRVWLSTLDSRTRVTHRRADGQRKPIGTPFTVGGAPLWYPGDPLGPAQEVIQCRCSVLLVERGEPVDLTGRPDKTNTPKQ